MTALYPRCPTCGYEAEEFYRDTDGAVVGCEKCLKPVPWWEYEQELDRFALDAHRDLEFEHFRETGKRM